MVNDRKLIWLFYVFIGLLSLLFVNNPEAGFAHYNTCKAVAYSISFAFTTFLCFSIKIFIGALIATCICYTLEIKMRKTPKHYRPTKTFEDAEKEVAVIKL